MLYFYYDEPSITARHGACSAGIRDGVLLGNARRLRMRVTSKLTGMAIAIATPEGADLLELVRERAHRFELVPNPELSRLRDDHADVFDLWERRLITGTQAIPPASSASIYVPVWEVHPGLGSLGLELWVQDDDDATRQLDLVYEALSQAGAIGDRRRSHITVCPRRGWQGYGWEARAKTAGEAPQDRSSGERPPT